MSNFCLDSIGSKFTAQVVGDHYLLLPIRYIRLLWFFPPTIVMYINTSKLSRYHCFLVIDVVCVVWGCGLVSLNYDVKSWEFCVNITSSSPHITQYLSYNNSIHTLIASLPKARLSKYFQERLLLTQMDSFTLFPPVTMVLTLKSTPRGRERNS